MNVHCILTELVHIQNQSEFSLVIFIKTVKVYNDRTSLKVVRARFDD